MVSGHTGLVFYITFVPRREARIRGDDMIRFLGGKYKFDQKGMCFFKTGSNENIALDVMNGAINIMAFQDDKTAIMFSK